MIEGMLDSQKRGAFLKLVASEPHFSVTDHDDSSK